MENIEVADELRVSMADFQKAQREARVHEPRRLTHLLAIKPDSENKAHTVRRIYSLTVV